MESMDKLNSTPSKLPAVLGLIPNLVFAGFDRNKPTNELSELVFSGIIERHDDRWAVIVGDRRLEIELHAKFTEPSVGMTEWTSGRASGRLFVRSNTEAELISPIVLGYLKVEDADADDLRLVARGRLVKLDLDEGLATLRVNPLSKGLSPFDLTVVASLDLMNKLHPGRGYEITGKLRGNVLTATRATRATLLEKASRAKVKRVVAPPLASQPEDLLE
jgi:hypothetical protein